MTDDGRAVAQAFYDAINDSRLEQALALLSADVRWSRPPDVPVTGTIEGVGGVERMWRAFTGSLESFEIVPKHLEARGERVLATITMRGSSPDGGGFEFGGCQVFTVAGGRITAVEEFRSLDEGREALAR